MIPLKYNTASQEISLGRFVDSTDGDTEETGLTIANTDIKLWKTGATTLASKNSGGATHIANGEYYCVLDATDTGTYGPMKVAVHVAGALAVQVWCLVMNVNAYNALYAAAGTGSIEANAVEISGDATAADNLELQYDTTGVSGDTFPATQAQIGNIATGSAAISVVAESDVVTTGSEVNTYVVTDEVDQVYHEITDAAGAMELYYQFDVSGNGVASEVTMTGRLFSANDSIGVYAYNWAGTSWDQIGTLNGSGGSSDSASAFNLLTRHTGTGANLGKVRVRGYAASGLTSSTLYIDQAIVSYAVVAQSVGYDGGKIWVDTVDGTAGTESYVNGVADNQVLTFADALTIASNLTMHQYNISPDSTLAPAADLNNANVYGVGYTLTLGGYDYAGTHFYHASPVTGIATAQNNSDHMDFLECIIGNITMDDAHFTDCSFNGTVTFSATQAGEFKVIDCRSVIAGSTTPIFDFNTGAGINHDLTIANWQNGIEIRNFNNSGTDLMSMSGTGQLIIAASCAGGTVNLRGQWKVTDNSGGAVSITYDDVAQNAITILADTNDIQTRIPAALVGGRMDSDVEAINNDTTAADNLAKGALGLVSSSVSDASATTTSFVTALTEATDNHYIGRIITFTSGDLAGQSTDITDYVGSTKTVTVTALTEPPANSVTFVIT